jgi:hypothetical protein
MMDIFGGLEKKSRSRQKNFDIFGFESLFSNSHIRVKSERDGIFFPAKHKELSNIITIKSVSGAREAVRKIKALLRKRKYSAKQLRAALILAGARAKVIAKTKAKDPKVKRRLLQVAKIYLNAAKRLGKK